TLHCGVVLTPDAEWASRIRPFLAHKQPAWRAHIDASLERPLGGLKTRFYVGTLGDLAGPVVTCVMVADARGVGLLGYVFTAPEQRGKGAYTALMAHQMADCRKGSSILTLTTNPDATAVRIYERFGFQRIDASSGRMKWLAHPDAETEWFRSASSDELCLHPLAWDDWPTLNLTALRVPAPDEPLEELPRSWALYLKTNGTAEGTFADVHPDWAHAWGRRPRERATHAVTVRTPTGAVAGWLLLHPDSLSMGTAQHVELYLHPTFVETGRPLLSRALRELPVNDGVLTTYTSQSDGYRASLMREAGFHHAAALPSWIEHAGTRHDVHVFRRG
ncbi:MAG TPA: GNAT family N-acetyltransferase, partial [Chloroflexota bacterium]|nr:GNAT family N-acetyltransferase [Chloroflexota bacterium]